MNNNNGAISFDAVINDSDFQRKFDEMSRRISGFSKETINETQKVDDSFKKLGSAIGAYMTFDYLKDLASQIVTVRGEFQQLETSFRVMLGSKAKADALMGQVVQIASETPFGLKDIGSAVKMLVAYGTSSDKAVDSLRMLGDVASGVGQPLNDIVYLYGTLQTQGRAYAVDIRQFAGRGIPIYKELANVLKISESEVNKFVESGKVGFKEVEQAFKNMSGAGGIFANAMQEQSKTITGLVSTLKDNIDQMFNDIGKNQEGFISGTIKAGISVTQNYQTVIDILKVLTLTYGAYRTAIILSNVVESVAIATKSGWTIATLAQYRALLLVESAQATLNATMLANPYVLAGTLLVGLASAVYLYSTNTAIAERATSKFNEQQSEYASKLSKIKSETASLSNTIKDNSSSQSEQEKAYKRLQQIYPDVLKNITLHQFKTMDATKAQRDFNDAINEMGTANLKAELSKIDVEISTTKKSLSNLRTTPQLGVSGGTSGQFYNLSRNLQEQEALRKEYVEKLNETRRAERKATDDKVKENTVATVKNKKYYEDQISNLEMLQQKYDVGSAKYKEYQSQIDKLNEIINPKKGKKEEEIAPFGSIRYWEQVAEKAQKAIEVSTNPAKTKQLEAERQTAEKKAEELRKQAKIASFEDEINEKKKQYQLYENWVQSISKDSAKKQFSELVKNGETYASYLKGQIDSFTKESKNGTITEAGNKRLVNLTVEYNSVIGAGSDIDKFKESLVVAKNEAKNLAEYLTLLQGLQSGLGKDDTTLGIQKRLELSKSIVDTENQIRQNLKSFIENSQNAEQQILNVITKYNNLRADNDKQFLDKKSIEYIKNQNLINEAEKADLKNIEDSRIQNLESYKKLQNSLYEANREGLKKRIQDELAYLETVRNSYGKNSDEYKKQNNVIIGLQSDLQKSTLDVAKSFASLASELGGLLSEVGGAFGQIGGLLSGVSGSFDKLSVSFDKTASKTDVISSGISGIIDLTNMLVSASNERNKAEKEYQANALSFEKNYSLALNERLGLMSQSEESVFLKNYQGRLSDSFKMFNDASSKYKEALDKLNQGQAKIGQQNNISGSNIGKGIGSGAVIGGAIGSIVPVIGTAIGAGVGAIVGGLAGLFGGKKKEDSYGALLEVYPDLIKTASNGQKVFNKDLAQTLITDNQVNDATKALLQSTIDWTNQMEKAKETVRSIISELAGSLGNSLRDSLVKAFKDGTDAAKSFGDSVSSVLEDILSQLIFNQVFSNAFKTLEEQLMASSDLVNGGDNNWIDDFGRFFEQADGLWNQFYAGLSSAQQSASMYGLSVFQKTPSGGTSSSALSGAIKGMTQETAGVLAGQFNVIRINSASQVALTREGNAHLAQISKYSVNYLPYLKDIYDKLNNMNSADSILRSKGIGG